MTRHQQMKETRPALDQPRLTGTPAKLKYQARELHGGMVVQSEPGTRKGVVADRQCQTQLYLQIWLGVAK